MTWKIQEQFHILDCRHLWKVIGRIWEIGLLSSDFQRVTKARVSCKNLPNLDASFSVQQNKVRDKSLRT